MKDFFINNMEMIGIIGAFIIGLILPNPKIWRFGKNVGDKLPSKIAKELADKLDSFEQGLRGKEYKGDKTIVSNEQIKEETEKLKVDLGLKE
ncbi:hypothetical protein AAA294_01980 [Fusobacterium varium]|uniref:hypothetical protein n=1 Tax=Fusobacterium varium TaxID=856 RepID=UPI0032C1E334